MARGGRRTGAGRKKSKAPRPARFLLRLPADLRRDLERAAGEGSLNGEIVQRLKRSFGETERIDEIVKEFGGAEAFSIIKAAAEATSIATMGMHQEGGGKLSWLDHPAAFDVALKIIAAAITQWRPPGDEPPPATWFFAQKGRDPRTGEPITQEQMIRELATGATFAAWHDPRQIAHEALHARWERNQAGRKEKGQ